jgi:hypothetical protein
MVGGGQHNPYDLNFIAWVEDRYDYYITVWSGNLRLNHQIGVILVAYAGHHVDYWGSVAVESQGQTGALQITGATDEILTLKTESNQVLFFDVPAGSFVDSIKTKLPTATPVPTETYLKNYSDDAPDRPLVYDYSPQNTDLNFLINSAHDNDWFRFKTQVTGSVSVILSHEPGGCGIRLVRLNDTNGIFLGENISQGNGKKEIVAPNQEPGDYLVRVWCPDGAYDLSKPYTLRFDAPLPKEIQPVLDCISENPDGTFIAYFGYNNPNSFIIQIDAGDQNSFHPGPIFRTNQNEAFAPGQVINSFGVLFDGNDLTWTLDGTSVTANRNSPSCP